MNSAPETLQNKSEARRSFYSKLANRARDQRGLQERLFQISDSTHPQQIAEAAIIRTLMAKVGVQS